MLVGLYGSGHPAPPTTASTSPTTASETADAQAQAQLTRLLPAGYPAGSCEPGSIPAGARAVMSGEANTDAGGPTSGTYILVETRPRCGRRSIR
ncbi:hypothetical protein HZU40_00245 (plasmid) [Mycolicibacterium fluoranthenivorans]|uniref:Uncharacterized protein n=1 Tax=Mycolicibacterium fluoranthenivorans TaxID=258505 RepID=A0A7G8P6G7_9MYCO|nr:hypothetical protein [Mycolicibacterium fluoranthenivorans]QNJ89933.1 hypothetical protein HZU40_00245 [Mycolicibacterium fluoranthenivorans]